MSSTISREEEEEAPHVILPPVLIHNNREKVVPHQIPVQELVVQEHTDHVKQRTVPYPEEPPVPIPKFPLQMMWNPNTLYFELEEEPVTHRIWIRNCSNRPMYYFYCGLWGDVARLGASWCCSPHTRIWLSPGLAAEMAITAIPRDIAPVKCAVANMQIAAGHMRDMVTAYFSIPIQVKYLKYIPPPSPEGEYNE